MRSKLKLSFITNNNNRKATFNKRKSGLMKKLDEITTLCDVRACAVIHSPYAPNLEIWPSTQGVAEVASRFMELPEAAQLKNMMSHETYLQGRIDKEQREVKKLSTENRESQLRQLMFDCLEGKMKLPSDPRDLQDLISYIHNYINKLKFRSNHLTVNGESSSSVPLHPPVVANVYPPIVADAGYDQNQRERVKHEPVQHHVPDDFYDPTQNQNMNMNQNQNQHEPVQYHAPIGFDDHIQSQNQHEAVQYHAPIGLNDHMNMNQYQPHGDLNDQVQYGVYGMNWNQNMNLDFNHSMGLNSNQYPYQQASSMNMVMGYPPQEMGFNGEHAHIPFMDGYHQLKTGDLATTGHLPSTTTASVHAPYFNNNL